MVSLNLKFNKIVENTIYRNDIIISKKTEIRKGELFNQKKIQKEKVVFLLRKIFQLSFMVLIQVLIQLMLLLLNLVTNKD